MIKILLDTNIILDIALKRNPFYSDSKNVILKIDKRKYFGYITATTVTDIYYIAKKDKGHKKALEFLQSLITILDVLGIDGEIIQLALQSQFLDFEDAIQYKASEFNEINFIITRNSKDFIESTLKYYRQKNFCNYIKSFQIFKI